MITINQEIQLINQYLPNGGVWNAKVEDETNLRAVVLALATIINKLRSYGFEIEKELNILNTNNFISDWEMYVGIPDDIFSIEGTLEGRIKNVLIKLIGLKAKTRPEIKALVKTIFDIDINFYPAAYYSNSLGFDYTFDFFLSDPSSDGLYTIITIETGENQGFDYTFDFPLGGFNVENFILSLIDFDKVGFVLFQYI